jgi:tetratricopeptide (TPR) repeat protein
MLQNLHRDYLLRKDWARAVETLDFIIIGYSSSEYVAPPLAAAYKRRGLFQMELKRYEQARRDLEKYLSLEPEALDREEIRKQLHAIHLWLARVN